MAFNPYEPISETNRLPVTAVVTGAFEEFKPVSDTNPLPCVVTDPP